MKAKMADNLILAYQKSELAGELTAVLNIFGWQDYFEIKAFLKSIEGRIVDLEFTHGNAFEANDGVHWLPNSIWTPV